LERVVGFEGSCLDYGIDGGMMERSRVLSTRDQLSQHLVGAAADPHYP
jgi:hypothetical protein